jgi:peptidoglycan/LPS O-acetylase OafA/YrhL
MPHGLELGWTLASEMTFYLMAPFILRSRTAPFVVLGLSVLLRIVVYFRTQPYGAAWSDWAYYFFPSTALFFMLGHIGRVVHKKMPIPAALAWASLALIPLLLLAQDGRYGFENPYFYPAICLFALALPRVFYATKDNRFSNFLGDLTYPLYLTHGVLIVLLESNNSPIYRLGQSILIHGSAVPGAMILRGLAVSIPIWLLAISFAAAAHFFIELPMRALFNGAFARVAAPRSMRVPAE